MPYRHRTTYTPEFIDQAVRLAIARTGQPDPPSLRSVAVICQEDGATRLPRPDVERPVKCEYGIAVVCPVSGLGWRAVLGAGQSPPCSDRCLNRGRVGESMVSCRLIA
jgi:hypothetical protein